MSKVVRGICVAAVLCVVAVLVAAACTGAKGEPVDAPAENRPTPAAAAPDRETHLLLLGCDRAASLTDSILLVSVSPSGSGVRALQLPRDTYAAYTERDYKKLNGAYHTLGADGIRQWLASALGVQIDHVAVYDLDCVRRAVDAVGGVEVDIPCPMRYSDPVQGLEIDLPAGRHRLSGTQAEQFVRFRAGYADADLGRLDAQKQFLDAFLRACRSLAPADLVRVCMTVLPDVKTDLPIGDAVRLALALKRADAPELSVRTAPGDAAKGVSGAWYYILSRAGMTDALAWWSAEAEAEFDPERVFDRPGNPDFHRIYTAPAAVPSGGTQMEEIKTEALPTLADASPEELAHAIFDVLDAKKAKDIKVLHVREQTVLTDYFVICTGLSNTQIKSLGGEVEYKLGLRGVDPRHFEGRDNNNWVVLDYGTVILHIFSRESRDFYKLEKLYGDAEEVHFMSIDEKAEQEEKAEQ